MIPRIRFDDGWRRAVEACDPAVLVRDAWQHFWNRSKSRDLIGIAMGKAAMAMARGAGPVTRGIAVTNADDGKGIPEGWRVMIASHPEPDERSLEAGEAVIDLVATARAQDIVLALISGGASALVERPVAGMSLDQLRTEIRTIMASGAPIHEINRARIERSQIKGGKLAAMCEARVVTYVVSDVFDDDVAIIGSGPTIANRSSDHIELLAPMRAFADAMRRFLNTWGIPGFVRDEPITGDVAEVADLLVREHPAGRALVAWGEPTVRLPADPGDGGRAQQLALLLARKIRGTNLSAFVAGSDGIDGPRPRGRLATPAGAFVDATTWDHIISCGIDPERALARCDAGTALAAAGAVFVTGPTGINHGDIAVLG